jgi:transposase
MKKPFAVGRKSAGRRSRKAGYAPDPNPAEGIWRHLKRVELKNVCCRDLDHLRAELRKAKERLRHKKHIIQASIRQPGYV